jgi:hypothetical protein
MPGRSKKKGQERLDRNLSPKKYPRLALSLDAVNAKRLVTTKENVIRSMEQVSMHLVLKVEVVMELKIEVYVQQRAALQVLRAKEEEMLP